MVHCTIRIKTKYAGKGCSSKSIPKPHFMIDVPNFNYWYGIGLLLVFLLVNQVLTGIQVGSYYIVSIDVALSSVDYLMREITYGWSFRYLHSNGAY